VWASEAVDLITDLRPAADLVGVLAAQAEKAMAHSSAYPVIRRSPPDG
jgi:nitronate monooxygenase